MKKLRLLLLMMACFIVLPSMAQPPIDNPLKDVNDQLRTIFSPLSRPSPKLEYLYDMSGHVTDDKFWTHLSYDTSSTDNWYRLYWESFYMKYDTTTIPHSDSMYAEIMQMSGDTIPVGLLDIEYYKLKPNALTTKDYFNFDTKNDLLSDIPGRKDEPYTHSNIFAFAPLYHESPYGIVTWKVDPKYLFIDAFNKKFYNLPYEFFIDFGDGSGFQKIDPTKVTYYTIDYKQSKEIIMNACIKQDGMLIKHSRSTFYIGASSASITRPDETYTYNDLNISIFKTCTDTFQRKIVIYLEGFDPQDFSKRLNKDGTYTYNMMIRNPKISQLRNFGYDFYMVDWGNSRRDMRMNAMSVVLLIEKLKAELGNESQFVIIGESMGGVIARYTMCFMESIAYTDPTYWPIAIEREKMHNTRLLITIDSPHQGANIPMALQLFYDRAYKLYKAVSFVAPMVTRYLSDYFGDNIVGCTAARQLLIHHVSTRSGLGLYKQYTEDPQRTSFVNDLQMFGNYPRYAKLMAISDGALTGEMQTRYYNFVDRVPNDDMLNFSAKLYTKILWFIKVPLMGADLNIKTNPDGQGKIIQANAGAWGIRIKFYLFGVKLITGYNSLINVSEYADLRAYCVYPGGYFEAGLEKVVGNSQASSKFDLSRSWWLNLFSYRAGSDGNGCWKLKSHVGFEGFASTNYDMSVCSDGMHFGFVPIQSALDYGVLGVSQALNHNIEADPIATILSNTPFDVIVANASTDVNFMGTHNLNRPHLYLKYTDRNTFAVSEMQQHFTYCLNNNIWGHWINREIGDYLLYLDNLEVNWNSLFEASSGILINDHNPWYAYVSGGGSHAGFYSKEDPFLINGSSFVEFRYDMWGIPPGPFVYNWPVTGTWTTNQSVGAACLNCINYARTAPVAKTEPSSAIKNTSGLSSEIYPNPSDVNGTLVIHSTRINDTPVIITIKDLMGRTLVQKELNNEAKSIYTSIPLSSLNLSSGMYAVTIKCGEDINVHKLVIQ